VFAAKGKPGRRLLAGSWRGPAVLCCPRFIKLAKSVER
jgi:hypothetical protein